MRFYGRELNGLHMPFNFQLITTPWRAPAVHRVVATYEGALPAGAWPNWVLGNHDRSRIASRVGASEDFRAVVRAEDGVRHDRLTGPGGVCAFRVEASVRETGRGQLTGGHRQTDDDCRRRQDCLDC